MDKGWGNNKLLIIELISRLKPLTQHYFDSTVGALTNNYVEKLFCYLLFWGLYNCTFTQRQIKTRGLLVRVTRHVYYKL